MGDEEIHGEILSRVHALLGELKVLEEKPNKHTVSVRLEAVEKALKAVILLLIAIIREQ
jgi:hypothetical protein